jgi:acetylornithine deacetylase
VDEFRDKPARIARWIKDYLEDIGAQVDLQIVEPDRANVVGKLGPGKKAGLLLSGHIDVVLAGEASLWEETTPFEPRLKGGKLFGRGACDMKGPDACILDSARQLSKEDFKRQLTVSFTAGEDTGGWFVNRLISENKVNRDDAAFGIIPEPSMMDIVRTHKGGGSAKVLIYGRAAHSNRPELGVNAIMKASDFLQEFKRHQRRLQRERNRLLGPTTMECTLINGGFKANIIPDRCLLTINSRLIPGHDDPEIIKGWFNDMITRCREKDPDFKADLIDVTASQPLDVPEDSEVVRLLKSILKKEPIGVPYYTEAVSYSRAGIPTVICGPGSIDQAHTPDEYITVKQLDLGVNLFKEVIKRVCL